MKVLYLPPYSPDFNPVEKMWSKMNAILRCWKIRSLDLLPDAIQKALLCFSSGLLPRVRRIWLLLGFLMIAIK